eukprot:scaffold10410_cov144-Isochrysis_galbana.AAC.4
MDPPKGWAIFRWRNPRQLCRPGMWWRATPRLPMRARRGSGSNEQPAEGGKVNEGVAESASCSTPESCPRTLLVPIALQATPAEDAPPGSQGPAEGPPWPGPEAIRGQWSALRRRRSLLAPSARASAGMLGCSPNPYTPFWRLRRVHRMTTRLISPRKARPGATGAFSGAVASSVIRTLSFGNIDVVPSGSAHPAGEVGTQEERGASPLKHNALAVRYKMVPYVVRYVRIDLLVVKKLVVPLKAPATLVLWATAWPDMRGGCAHADLRTPTLYSTPTPRASSPIPLRPYPTLPPALVTAHR